MCSFPARGVGSSGDRTCGCSKLHTGVQVITMAAPEVLAFAQWKFIEEYKGDKIPAGHRGLTLSLTYRAENRTLREEEVNESHQNICQALVSRLGAVLR